MATPGSVLASGPIAVPVRIIAGNPPTVSPDPATIRIHLDQEVVWECVDASGQPADFKVIFKGKSPFNDREFHRGKAGSGRPRGDVTPDPTRPYAYLVIAGGVLDPNVIVEQ